MAKSFDFLERDSGNPYELSFIGKVNEAVLKNLFHNKPFDKEIYNKMTRFFTLNFKNESCNLSSSHYGTEIYIEVFSNEDALFLENLMAKNQENFSFHQL
ncbi:MAG: hypothetical protein Q4E36_05995 [Bacillota bacterium]|nr:hypothetical protein [Bacillota bacterium]